VTSCEKNRDEKKNSRLAQTEQIATKRTMKRRGMYEECLCTDMRLDDGQIMVEWRRSDPDADGEKEGEREGGYRQVLGDTEEKQGGRED
jgi:hypothetical protein